MKLIFKRREKKSRQASNPDATNVFSYYASRSPRSEMAERHENKKTSKMTLPINWQTIPIYLAIISILISAGYLLLLEASPRIEIVASTPEKKQIMQSTGIYQRVGQELLSKSVFNRLKLTVDTNKLASDFKMRFPELSDVVIITPIAGHKLIFEIELTTPVLALVPNGGSDYIVLDERGRALFKTSDTSRVSSLKIPTIIDESGIGVEVGDNVLPTENINFITDVIQQLQAQNIPIQSVNLPPIANELRVKPANQSYYVRFNIVGDARLQAGSFIATMRHLEREGVSPGVYVDVRTVEKVYYQ